VPFLQLQVLPNIVKYYVHLMDFFKKNTKVPIKIKKYIKLGTVTIETK